MSALTLSQTLTAIGPGLSSSFGANGGTSPYTYSVRANGAGGSINSSTGLYTAPSQVGETPQTLYDTVQVVDSSNPVNIATAQILVGSPLLLFCDIIQTYLGLSNGRVYLWDQKIMQPTDSGLYVAVSVPVCKPFGNTSVLPSSGTFETIQSVNMMATLDIDIISRGPAARDQKELVILALRSNYSQQQQEANSFYIAALPPGSRFINLSQIDGAAIPYRYKISVNMQYFVTNVLPINYFGTFQAVSVATNP